MTQLTVITRSHGQWIDRKTKHTHTQMDTHTHTHTKHHSGAELTRLFSYSSAVFSTTTNTHKSLSPAPARTRCKGRICIKWKELVIALRLLVLLLLHEECCNALRNFRQCEITFRHIEMRDGAREFVHSLRARASRRSAEDFTRGRVIELDVRQCTHTERINNILDLAHIDIDDEEPRAFLCDSSQFMSECAARTTPRRVEDEHCRPAEAAEELIRVFTIAMLACITSEVNVAQSTAHGTQLADECAHIHRLSPVFEHHIRSRERRDCSITPHTHGSCCCRGSSFRYCSRTGRNLHHCRGTLLLSPPPLSPPLRSSPPCHSIWMRTLNHLSLTTSSSTPHSSSSSSSFPFLLPQHHTSSSSSSAASRSCHHLHLPNGENTHPP